jgi:hypothetical protein
MCTGQTVRASVTKPACSIGKPTIVSLIASFAVVRDKRKYLNLTGRVKFVSKNRQLANISETDGRGASRIAPFDAELYSDTISDAFPELWDLPFSRYSRKTVLEMLKQLEAAVNGTTILRTALHCIFRGRSTV